MARHAAEDLETFLRRQDAAALVAVLLELANDHEAVQARLARMQLADRPDKLATGFRKTLAGWRRSTRFHGYREAREFGSMLEGWLDQVARELLPKDPPAALALFESFIEADSAWFERADDSDGAIGDAVRAACVHWLQAAARCETPPGVWPERLVTLYEGDEYGAREELLRRADLLLDEPALRRLAAGFEARLAEAHARQIALQHEDLPAAAKILIQLYDAPAAEARLVAEAARIDGRDYGRLVPLAKSLREHDCPGGETAVYRALLQGILDRAYVGAYGHAARYLARLGEIAAGNAELHPLRSHEDFAAEIRQRHGRKPAFWAYVNGSRRDRHDEIEDDLPE